MLNGFFIDLLLPTINLIKKQKVVVFLLLLCIFYHTKAQQYNLHIYTPDSISVNNYIKYSKPNGLVDSFSVIYETKRIIEKLQNNGFLAASLDTIKWLKSEKVANVYIYPRKQYFWLIINKGNIDLEELNDAGIKLKRYSENVLRLKDFNMLKNDIVTWYNNHGYPFASVWLTNVEIKDSLVSASLYLEKHKKFFFDSIIVKGDATIPVNYLRNYLGIKKNEVYAEHKIQKADQRLNEIDFVKALKPVEIDFKEKHADVYTYLSEQKANRFYGIAGLLSDPDKDQNLIITGELDLLLTNAFSRGEQIVFNWQRLESATQELNSTFAYPYIFGSAVGFQFDFELYKKDSSYLTTQPGLLFRFFLEGDHYFKLFVQNMRSSLLLDPEKYNEYNEGFSNVTKTSYGLGYHISRLDYKYNPQKGFAFDIESGYGKKTKEQQKDSGFVDFTARELETVILADWYISLWPKNMLNISGEAGCLSLIGEPLVGEEEMGYSENELFRVGGANSLRGFNEDALLAQRYAIISAEYRYLFEKNSNLFIFWDGAYYLNTIEGLTEDFPFGFGVGANLASKAGIFTISYALGKQFDNPVDIRSAKIHIGYINLFR